MYKLVVHNYNNWLYSTSQSILCWSVRNLYLRNFTACYRLRNHKLKDMKQPKKGSDTAGLYIITAAV